MHTLNRSRCISIRGRPRIERKYTVVAGGRRLIRSSLVPDLVDDLGPPPQVPDFSAGVVVLNRLVHPAQRRSDLRRIVTGVAHDGVDGGAEAVRGQSSVTEGAVELGDVPANAGMPVQRSRFLLLYWSGVRIEACRPSSEIRASCGVTFDSHLMLGSLSDPSRSDLRPNPASEARYHRRRFPPASIPVECRATDARTRAGGTIIVRPSTRSTVRDCSSTQTLEARIGGSPWNRTWRKMIQTGNTGFEPATSGSGGQRSIQLS